MMRPEWEPGDVAMMRCRDGVERVAMLTDRKELSPLWVAASEDWGRLSDDVPVRRLVVIDPEDAEQVERLLRLWVNTSPDDAAWLALVDNLTTALREFANPTPRIEEPQGLGAVVEAIYDNHFVHLGNGQWSRVGPHDCAPHRFEEIEVVRVLSEGVTP